jgi:hypothetical protein
MVHGLTSSFQITFLESTDSCMVNDPRNDLFYIPITDGGQVKHFQSFFSEQRKSGVTVRDHSKFQQIKRIKFIRMTIAKGLCFFSHKDR